MRAFLKVWDLNYKMNLKLDRPLAAFDLETTGLNTSVDRIVSLSIIKIFPDGSSESKTKLIHRLRLGESSGFYHTELHRCLVWFYSW